MISEKASGSAPMSAVAPQLVRCSANRDESTNFSTWSALTYLSRPAHIFICVFICVGSKSIRTSIDLPRDFHRRVHEAAARKGCSAREAHAHRDGGRCRRSQVDSASQAAKSRSATDPSCGTAHPDFERTGI